MNLKYKKLGEVCEILDSRRIPITASERKAGQYPYYGANGIQDYVADFIFDDELVLLAEDGGNFGSSDRPIAYRVSGKCWVNNHAHVLKPLPGIDVDYLCYALMFYDTSGLVNGATRQKLTQAAMRQMEIPIRSWDEQKTIVKKIKSAAGLIALRKSQVQKLDQLASSRFIEMFGDPVTNPKRWSSSPLGNLTDIVRGGSPRPIDNFLGGTIPWIKIGDATQGDDIYLHSTKDHIIEQGLAKTRFIKSGSLIFANCGVSLGFARIIKFDGCIHDGWLALGNISDRLNKIFLLKSLNHCTDFFRHTAPDGTQPNLNTSIMKNFVQIVPPIELQNEFAAFIEQLDKSKVTIRKSIEKLETTYRALLQEYFG